MIYGMLYLCFVAYPIVFVQYRGWSPGFSRVAFLGIGVASQRPRDGPRTARGSASAMIIGAVTTPFGQLIFAWSGLPPHH